MGEATGLKMVRVCEGKVTAEISHGNHGMHGNPRTQPQSCVPTHSPSFRLFSRWGEGRTNFGGGAGFRVFRGYYKVVADFFTSSEKWEVVKITARRWFRR